LSKTASAEGMDLNISPPTKFKFSVPVMLATTCGWSNTVHFTWGKSSLMSLTTAPVPPPTSTSEPNPSNTCLHSSSPIFSILESAVMASWNMLSASDSVGLFKKSQKLSPLALSYSESSFLSSVNHFLEECHMSMELQWSAPFTIGAKQVDLLRMRSLEGGVRSYTVSSPPPSLRVVLAKNPLCDRRRMNRWRTETFEGCSLSAEANSETVMASPWLWIASATPSSTADLRAIELTKLYTCLYRCIWAWYISLSSLPLLQ